MFQILLHYPILLLPTPSFWHTSHKAERSLSESLLICHISFPDGIFAPVSSPVTIMHDLHMLKPDQEKLHCRHIFLPVIHPYRYNLDSYFLSYLQL